jgi:hypothetical protein
VIVAVKFERDAASQGLRPSAAAVGTGTSTDTRDSHALPQGRQEGEEWRRRLLRAREGPCFIRAIATVIDTVTCELPLNGPAIIAMEETSL